MYTNCHNRTKIQPLERISKHFNHNEFYALLLELDQNISKSRPDFKDYTNFAFNEL